MSRGPSLPRGRRALAAAVGLAAALAVGHWLTTTFEDGGGGNAPFVRTGAVDEIVELSYAEVRVNDVRPAHRLLGPLSVSRSTQASGVYVVASVELTATREPTYFFTTQLLDAQDRLYLPSKKSECDAPVDSTTEVPTYAMLCFEVPTDRLAGLRLQVGRGSALNDSTRHDDLAEVDLGISEADEEDWATTDVAYRVVSASIEPFELETVDLEDAEPEPSP